jgi:leucyl aminopeptidase
MIRILVGSGSLLQSNARGKVIFLAHGFDEHSLNAVSTECAHVYDIIKERNFKGSTGSALVLPLIQSDSHSYLILAGVGKKGADQKIDIENYRRAIGKVMRVMEELKITSLAIELPQASLFEGPAAFVAGQTAQMIHIASYHFDEYITDLDRKFITTRDITILAEGVDKKELQTGIKKGEIIADAVNEARHWIDLPPIMLHPEILAQAAHDIARAHDLDFTMFGEEEIIKMGMGGLAAVSAGSDKDCHLVIMEYKTKQKNAPTIAFVGKGITFDSGGLSIKPANHMETMKEDMSGAAAVIATMKALAQLKPNVNVIGVAPISENLPSGTATKPGDIVRFYNGKTA